MTLSIAKKPSTDSIHKRQNNNNHNSYKSRYPVHKSAPLLIIQRKPTCPCGGGCPRCRTSLPIQAKLKIGQPNDKYEQEADRIADRVMQVQDSETSGISKVPTNIQRKCSTCTGSNRLSESIEEKEEVQRKPLASTITPLIQRQENFEEDEDGKLIQAKTGGYKAPVVAPTISTGIQSLQGGGRPLSGAERNYFEPRFGANFSLVRVHDDSNAANIAKSMNARAFTYGREVVFGQGEYDPGSVRGRKLMAHELTHAIQQRNTPLLPSFIQKQQTGNTAPRGVTSHNFRGCSNDQDFFVDLASSRVPLWIGSTISDLEDILRQHDHEIISTTKSSLNRFFHPPRGRRGRLATIGGRHRPATIRIIIRRLRRMMRALQNPRLLRCVSRRTCGRENSSGSPDVLAYAGRNTRISICPNFFNNQSLTDQISTLIHESAHHIGLMRNVIPRAQVINLPLNRAMTNAESYALLVIENFSGPPVRRHAITPLTKNWSPAYMSSEISFTNPIKGLFYEGRGRRRLLSSKQSLYEAPFMSIRPIRFRGQVRFYVDSSEMPMPKGTTVPGVRAQVLFIPWGRSPSSRSVYEHGDTSPQYSGPNQPLKISFDPAFDFNIRKNGQLRFTFWLEDARAHYAIYDDRVTVQPDNDL